MTVEIAEPASRRAQATARLMARGLGPLLVRLAAADITPRGLRVLANVERAMALVPRTRARRPRRVRFDGFDGEWIGAHRSGSGRSGSGRAVLYFHGGGFVLGGPAAYRGLVAGLSAAAGVPVLSVGYRQLPEVSLSGSVADGVTAYRQLLRHGYDPARVVLAGDSSGGLVTFATALRAAREGLPRPAAVVGLSPWLELDCTARRAHANAPLDRLILVDQQAKIAELLRDADPLADADLSLLPPALIQVGTTEVLRCDAERMQAAMERAGVPCRLQLWPDQIHVFQAFPALVPEARPALRKIGAYIREMT
jgi:acetyl esterase/lipase